MSNPDALVWGGKDGSSASAGKGSAFIIENQSAQIVKDTLSQVEQDRRRIDNAEKQRIAYGKMGQIKMRGWDVDRNRQLSEQYKNVNKYFTNAMSNDRNPFDYQNELEFGEYATMVADLEANMSASAGQEDFYIKQHTLLTQDRGKNYNYKKSMDKLQEYRDASISDREKMGADLLVPNIASPLDIVRAEIKHYKAITNQGKWYINANGERVQTEVKEIPKGPIVNGLLEQIRDKDDPEGDILRSHFSGIDPDSEEMIIAIEEYYDKFAPQPSVKENFKNIPQGSTAGAAKTKLLHDSYENDDAEIKSMQSNEPGQLAGYKGGKFREGYIDEIAFVPAGTRTKEEKADWPWQDNKVTKTEHGDYIGIKYSKKGITGESKQYTEIIWLDKDGQEGEDSRKALYQLIQSNKKTGTVKGTWADFNAYHKNKAEQKKATTFKGTETERIREATSKMEVGTQFTVDGEVFEITQEYLDSLK